MIHKLKHLVNQAIFDLSYPNIYFYPNPFKIYEYKSLIAPLQKSNNKHALDLGCGWGFQTGILANRFGRATGVDISEDAILRGKKEEGRRNYPKSLRLIHSTLEGAHFEAGSFDYIFSFSVLEHIPNYQEVIRECFRVLNPGGSLHFTIDSLDAVKDPLLIEKHKEEHWVVKYFSGIEIRDLLQNAGFEILVLEPFVCSAFGVRLFEAGIRSRFVYTQTETWRLYRQLVKQEQAASSGAGIYYLLRARKPA